MEKKNMNHQNRPFQRATVCEACGQASEKIVRCSICQKALCTDCAHMHNGHIHCSGCREFLVQQRVREFQLWLQISPADCSTVCPECDRVGFVKEELDAALAANSNFSKIEGDCSACGCGTMYQVNG